MDAGRVRSRPRRPGRARPTRPRLSRSGTTRQVDVTAVMGDSGHVSPRRQIAMEMAEAARGWLGSLTAEQRTVGNGAGPAYDGTVDAERRRWFYTPTDHGGLTMH